VNRVFAYALGASSPGEHLLISTLQGLLNRTQPRLFLRLDEHDDRWRDYLSRRYGLAFTTVDNLPDLLTSAREVARGYVLADPAVPATINAATVLAAHRDLLVARPEFEPLLQRAGLRCVESLVGRFRDCPAWRVDEWTLEQFMDRCDPRYVACLTVSPHEWFGKFAHHIRDMAMARRLFCFELSANPQHADEFALRDQLMKRIAPGGVVLGWHTPRDSEADHLVHASRNGNVVICCAYAQNLSFLQHLRPERVRIPEMPPAPALDRTKVYVSFIISDGDALWCCRDFQAGLYLDPARGQLPVGWAVQPLLLELAPAMLGYYIETATANDCLVASASGVGYSYADLMSAEQLEAHLTRTREKFLETGYRVLQFYEYPRHLQNPGMHAAGKRRYAARLGDLLLGVQEGYWAYHPPADEFWDGLVWAQTRFPDNARSNHVRFEHLAADIREYAATHSQRPLFIPVHPYEPEKIGPTRVREIMTALGGEFVTVRPDHLFALMKKNHRL
jgi:hypothetical protein